MAPRLQKETIKHRQAFAKYLALGPGRSLKKLSHQIAASLPSLKTWCVSFEWTRRASEADAKAGAKLEEKVIDEIAEMDRRHVMLARGVQAAYARRLQAGKTNPTAFDAKMFMDVERNVREKNSGSGSLHQQNINLEALDGVNADRLEAVVIAWAAQIVAARKRGDPGSGIIGVGALPCDARGVHREPPISGELA